MAQSTQRVMSSVVILPNNTLMEGLVHKRMLSTRQALIPRPPNHQSDAHPTEPPWLLEATLSKLF